MILSPGRTEPIEKYYEVVERVARRAASRCWCTTGVDKDCQCTRVQADRMPGHARGWRPFLSDYNRMIGAFEARMPKPWIGVGHSMGGGLTALALAEGEDRLAAAVLSAPMLGLNLGKRKPGEVGLAGEGDELYWTRQAKIRRAAGRSARRDLRGQCPHARSRCATIVITPSCACRAGPEDQRADLSAGCCSP